MAPRTKTVKKKLKQFYGKTLKQKFSLQNCKSVSESVDNVNQHDKCLLDALVLPWHENRMHEESKNVSNVQENNSILQDENTEENVSSTVTVNSKSELPNIYKKTNEDPHVCKVPSSEAPKSDKLAVCTQTAKCVCLSVQKNDAQMIQPKPSFETRQSYTLDDVCDSIRKHDIVISKSSSAIRRTSSNWSTGKPTNELVNTISLDEKRKRIEKYSTIYKSLHKQNPHKIHALVQVEKKKIERPRETVKTKHVGENSFKQPHKVHRRPRTKKSDNYSLCETMLNTPTEMMTTEQYYGNDIICNWNNNINRDNSHILDNTRNRTESITELVNMRSNSSSIRSLPNNRLRKRKAKTFDNSDSYLDSDKQIISNDGQGDIEDYSSGNINSISSLHSTEVSPTVSYSGEISELGDDCQTDVLESDAISFITNCIMMILLTSIVILLLNGFTIANIIFSGICFLSLLTILFAFPAASHSTIKTT